MHPDFALSEDIIHLNHAGVGPWPKRTAAAIIRFAEENARLGSVRYADWLERETLLREQFRQLLNAPSAGDIALVKNTSEAISFVAMGYPWQVGDNLVTCSEEFPSNRIPWEVAAARGVSLRRADFHSGIAPEEALFRLVDGRTRMIAISSVQYASGIRLDLEKVGAFCRAKQLCLCVDAIQSLGALQFDVQKIGADFVMADGHKWLLGPEGIGVFYSSEEARNLLTLTQYGWHMVEESGDYENPAWTPAASARRFECGSPNLLGIHGLSASLSLLLEIGMVQIEQAVLARTARLMDLVRHCNRLEPLFPRPGTALSGIMVFRHREATQQRLIDHLRNHGVVCAPRGGGIRFSPHFYTPEEQLERAIEIAAGCR